MHAAVWHRRPGFIQALIRVAWTKYEDEVRTFSDAIHFLFEDDIKPNVDRRAQYPRTLGLREKCDLILSRLPLNAAECR